VSISVLIIVALADIPIYLLFFKLFFSGWDGFVQSVIAIFYPDAFSALSGKLKERQVGRLTLAWFLFSCVITTAAVYHMVMVIILGIEHPWS